MTSKGTSIPTEGVLLWTQSDENLINAVTKRDISKVRSLMKKKANPTKISPKIGIAAIHQAACYEKADIMKALMVFPLIDINKTDSMKRAPVHHAAREGREECLEHLIQYQADTKLVENEGLTPLHLASMLGHLGCVQLLIPTLPSLEDQDTNGRTALYHAAARGSASICRLLLENGAIVDATDTDGKSSIMAAAENGHQAAFQYLLANRASVKLRDKKGRDVYWYAGSQVDYLLGLPSPSRSITASQSSNSSHNHENAIRDSVSSQPNLSSRWRPELDLTQVDPQRTPKNQDSVSQTTKTQTESDDHRSRRGSSTSEQPKTNAARNTENQRRDRDGDQSSIIEELTKERSALKQKMDEVTAENGELSDSTNEARQNLSNIRSNQQQIRILVKEVVQILTSSRQHPSSDDEEGGGEGENAFQKAVEKLSFALKFLEACDGAGSGAVVGLYGSESVLKELQRESGLEIERLKRALSEQKEVIAEQTVKLQQYEEKIREYAAALGEQAVVLKRFEIVKETVVKVTELDDVDDDHVADVIQEMADQCEKLHAANQILEERCIAAQQHSKQRDGKTFDGLEIESESRTPISDLLRKQIVMLRRSLETQIAILDGSDVISPQQTTAADDADVTDDVINASFERERQNRFRENVVASKQDSGSAGELARIEAALVPGLEVEGHSLNGVSERTTRYLRGTSVSSTNFEDSGFRTICSDPEGSERGLLCSPDYTTDTLDDNRSLRMEPRPSNARILGGERQISPVKTKSAETQTTAWQNDSNETLIREVKQLRDQNSTLQAELSLLRKGSFRSRRENRGSEDRKKRKGDRSDFDKDTVLSQGVELFSRQVETGAITESDSSSESLNPDTVKHYSMRTHPTEIITSSPAPGKLESPKTKTEPPGSAELEKSTLGKVSEKPPHPKHAANSRSISASLKTIHNSDHRSESAKHKSVCDTSLTPTSTLKTTNEDITVATSTHEVDKINHATRQNTRRDFHPDGRLGGGLSNRRHSSPHRGYNSSEEEETFEKIFETNNYQHRQNRKNSVSEPGSRTKPRQAKRSHSAGNSSNPGKESVSLENERLREELGRLKSEMKSLQQRQHNAAAPVGQRTLSNASFDAIDQQMNSKNEAQDDSKSLDGYRFLSEDENGTLKFKEFPLTKSGQLEVADTPGTKDFEGESRSMTSVSSPFSDSASQVEDGEKKTRKNNSGTRNKSSKRQKEKQKRRKGGKRNPIQRFATSAKEAETRFLNEDEPSTQKLSLVTKRHKSGKLQEKSAFGRNVSIEDYQIEIIALRRKIQEFERQHKMIIGIYRGHLLASIQGCLDSDVADALLRIVTLQDSGH